MISLHRFYFDSMLLAQSKKQRYGQALFNMLTEIRPELAEQVRGTPKDPFYMNGPADNPAKWDSFIEFIESQWRK